MRCNVNVCDCAHICYFIEFGCLLNKVEAPILPGNLPCYDIAAARNYMRADLVSASVVSRHHTHAYEQGPGEGSVHLEVPKVTEVANIGSAKASKRSSPVELPRSDAASHILGEMQSEVRAPSSLRMVARSSRQCRQSSCQVDVKH